MTDPIRAQRRQHNLNRCAAVRNLRLVTRVLAIALVAAGMLTATLARADCGAAPGGPPNSCPGVASTGGNGGPDAGVGNPLNVMTGNKYERELDMPALPGVLGLEVIRHYNSVNSQPGRQNGVMGRGWRLSYETELIDMYGKIQILQADGGRVIFNRDPKHRDLCSTRNPANGSMTLAPQKNGASEYIWTWNSGRKLFFDSAGKLQKIKAPTGEVVVLDYDQRNVLRRVTDPQGRSLQLVYADQQMADRFRGVQFIDSPVGRFEYQYGSEPPKAGGVFDTRNLLALMVRVKLPTGFAPDVPAHALTSRGTTTSRISRVYHHEDPDSPWLLTGISVEEMGASGKPVTARHSTYGYDRAGRAILSTHANNVDKVTLITPEYGKTVLTNSLGQKTTYQHAVIAGEHRLLEVRGAGCALCGETNIRYHYNKAGQLTDAIKLSDSGAPVSAIRTVFDSLGRTSSISKVAFVNGKQAPALWVARYDYRGDSFEPDVIARPSVVPGKEAVTRIVYNAVGQPLSVTETGWIPTLDGAQAAGHIERTTRYRYSLINNWSLLTEIDGPLPNGKTGTPADSDITLLEYDNRNNSWTPPKPRMHANGIAEYAPAARRAGMVTRIIAPGSFITEVLERDRAQRPNKLRLIDGDVVQVATVTSNWRGAPLHIDLTAGALQRRLQFGYTAAGQVNAITLPGKLRTEFQYDQAGQLTRTILPDGSSMLTAHDTEGRVQKIARSLDAGGSASETLPTQNFLYDRAINMPGRLTQVRDALGVSAHYRYNDLGQIITITNALGIAKRFGYGTDGLLAQQTDAANSPDAASIGLIYDSAGQATSITAPNGVTTQRIYDDFGQKIMEADPDHGATLFRHDAAGRIIARIDETLVATRYTFDHANRLLAVGSDKQKNLLQYQYRGRLLTTVTSTPDGNPEHATERTAYERDAFGRVIRETRWLASVTPQAAGAVPGVRFVTASNYDEAGRLVAQTLPDGHRLAYRYAVADRTDARAGPRPGQLEAILFDDRIVVTNIEQTIAGGLTGYTMGNGLRQQIKLDRRGRIEHLQVLPGRPGGWWQRVRAWLLTRSSDAPALYKQVNHYDSGGRLVTIERLILPELHGTEIDKRTDQYAYDAMNRLTGITKTGELDTTFRYDKTGNRIAETSLSSHIGNLPRTSARSSHMNRTFHYAAGSNRLLTIAQGATFSNAANSADPPENAIQKGTTDAGGTLRSAWFYHPTGVQVAQLRWTDKGEASNRRTVYNVAKRPVAVYENDQLIARYHYNNHGERIAKTAYPLQRAVTGVEDKQAITPGYTVYSLYRDHRLAAETDDTGRIIAHYVYLYGKPVAKIEMEVERSAIHRLWKAVSFRTIPTAGETMATIYAVITDHLGTPQQVMDEHQRVVWQAETTAFGQARVTHAAIIGWKIRSFRMDLRLPGQVFDEETQVNHNYLRDYDPDIGRYMTPDPTGLTGGTNPYAYVSNNPLTNVDPLGLYEEDIHYYMTYFLALAAGVDPRRAYIIATAAQYVDDNPITQPMVATLVGSAWQITASNSEQQRRLASYHFTQLVADDWTQRVEDRYIMNRKPENAQLQRLQNAAKTAYRLGGSCAGDIMFGEYLHAFEDTFGHRDQKNVPIQVNFGWGHAGSGHSPDHTFNQDFRVMWHGELVGENWKFNEDRTLAMQKEVFEKLKSLGDGRNSVQDWRNIESNLREFNRIFEDSESTERFTKYPNKKIDILNTRLSEFGYKYVGMQNAGELDLYRIGAGAYDKRIGKSNRDNLLRYNSNSTNYKIGDKFNNNDPNFNGAILP